MDEKQIQAGWGQIGEEDKGSKKQDREIDFLKLDFGDTMVRLLDPLPHAYKEWYIPSANGGKGSAIPHRGNDDLLEADNRAFMKKIFEEADKKGLKGKENEKARKNFLRDEGYKKQPWGQAKQKYIIHVIDRATGEIKLLDAGPAIFNKIKTFAQKEKYGDPRQYDITITKEDKKGNGNYFDIEYTVLPEPKEPLTEKELKEYEEKRIDLVELKDRADVSPEQAYRIAKGETWAKVMGNGSDSSSEQSEKSSEENLPKEGEDSQESPKEQPEVGKGEAIPEEELAKYDF